MTFLEDFQASLESLPVLLQRHYSVMRDLDDSLLVLQRQNEQRCEQEIEEIEKGIQCGNIKSDSPCTRFSDEALDELKHCIQISDEKVALALTAYDVVDRQIQQLDEYLKKCEVIRREGEIAAATGDTSLNAEANNTNSKTGRGLRKKYKTRMAEVADAAKLHSLGLQLDLPVDPNEPTYCFCNQVSYGEMVACDNPACKIEWFHFGCVGLEEHPKGKWFCSDCASTKKRGKGKWH